MKLDKTMFLVLAMITLFFIVLVGILARFGSKISTDPSFNMFFSWYVGLFMINLLNILGTLLFHFFLTDLPGERGVKGKPGEKGLEGEHDKCFCDTAFTTSMESINEVINKAEVEYANYLEIPVLNVLSSSIIIFKETDLTKLVDLIKQLDSARTELDEEEVDGTLNVEKNSIIEYQFEAADVTNVAEAKNHAENLIYKIKTFVNAYVGLVDSTNDITIADQFINQDNPLPRSGATDDEKVEAFDIILNIYRDYYTLKKAIEVADTNLQEKLKDINNYNENTDMVTLIKQKLQPEKYSEATNIHSHGVKFSNDPTDDLSTSLIHKHNPEQKDETATIKEGGRVPHDHA